MTQESPYGASRVTRGLVHLIGGKAVISVAGIGTFLILVRSLPVEQFATYSVLFALVDLIDAVTGVGLSHVLARYIPELFEQRRHAPLGRLIAYGLALRIVVLALLLASIYGLAPAVAPLIGLADWEWAVRAYLAVVLIRVAAMSLFGVLESMLHVGIAQFGFGLATVLRFVLLWVAVSRGPLDLETVILIEVVSDSTGFGVMLLGLLVLMRQQAKAASGDSAAWLRANLRRMASFGAKGYVQHLLILPFGGSTNRLLVGGSLSSAEVALFGFGQSVADLIQRYLPVRLLAGIIRPVLTARFVRKGQFTDIERAANLIFKANAVIICLAAVVFFSGGEPMLGVLSADKYGEGGVGLLLLMCAAILAQSLRHTLDHVSHAVERNGPLIWSNVVITLSVLPGIALLPVLGIYAMPAANVVGIALGCVVLIWRLRSDGFDYRHDMNALARMAIAVGGGVVSGATFQWMGAAWLVTVAVGVSAFCLAIWMLPPWSASERDLVITMLRNTRYRAARSEAD